MIMYEKIKIFIKKKELDNTPDIEKEEYIDQINTSMINIVNEKKNKGRP